MDDIQVVGLGLAALDVLMRLEEMPTWERATTLSEFGLDGGGPVATAMVAASRLGIRAGYVGTAGSDRTGNLKVESLTENGVDVSRLVRRPGPEKQEDRFHTPAFEVDALDTTGAGDVFHGAFIVGLLQGWDLRTTALFSSAVSAVKCTQLGGRSGIPTLDRALAFLHTRGFDIP